MSTHVKNGHSRLPNRWSRMGTGLAAAVLTVLVLAAGPAPAAVGGTRAAPTDWLTYGYDVQRSGNNPAESKIGVANVAGLHMLWGTDLGGVMIAQAVQASGINVNGSARTLIYEGTEHGDFYALRPSDGSVQWHVNLGSVQTACEDMPNGVFGIGGTGVIQRTGSASGVIYVAGGDGSIHALDLATGAERTGWPMTHVFTPQSEHVYGGLTLLSGKLYVTTASHCDATPYYGRTIEVDVATHSIVGLFFPAGPPSGGVQGGGIWGPGGVSIDPSNGHVFAATGNALTSPESYLYSENVVELTRSLHVLGSNYPGLSGSDVDFGSTPILYKPAGCPTVQMAAMAKDGVLVVYDEGNVSAGPTQRLQMAGINGDKFVGIPAWDPTTNTLFVTNSGDSSAGTFLHGMVALKAAADCTLSLAWQQTVGPNHSNVSPPTVANGVVYYGDGPGHVEHAFDAATGAKLWTSGSTVGVGIWAAPTVVGGRLLVPAWDGKLYAFGP